jgi:hypothetical protein
MSDVSHLDYEMRLQITSKYNTLHVLNCITLDPTNESN